MVIAYLRVSTEKQHLENQHLEISKFAEARNIKIDRWVTEIVSGKTKRSERRLGALIRRLKKGDTLIVTELSRLSRTLLDIMSILNICMEKQITVYSTKDGYAFDNNINSKVLAFAFGLVAEIEHNLISLRTKEALALKKAEGIRIGRPVGSRVKLQKLIDDKKKVIDMLNQGVSIAHICREYQVSRGVFYQFRNQCLAAS
ncbi:MAG: recombinase family protein [Rikenella sp.]|nr:recombinase family protein [Rikenella sp.]